MLRFSNLVWIVAILALMPSLASAGDGCNLWAVSADAIFLSRTAADYSAYSTSADGEFDFELGWQFDIRREMFDDFLVQARHFGVENWRSNMSYANVGSSGSIAYSSVLYSTEANVCLARHPRITWLLGFRAIKLYEHWDSSFDDIIAIRAYQGDVRNHMYGGQLGVLFDVYDQGGPLDIDIELKGGIFYNHLNIAGHDFIVPFNSTFSTTSYLAEVGAVAKYQVLGNVHLRAGYQVMWLADVGMAPNSFADAADATTDNTLMVHGGNAGVEVTW